MLVIGMIFLTKYFYMEHTSTNLDLMRFLYSELPEKKVQYVNENLLNDPLFKRRYQILKKAKRMLPSVKFEPSRHAVNFILQYSRNEALIAC